MNKMANTFFKLSSYDLRKLTFELVVVFLGVTAGFLLNNWRVEEQESKLEKKYVAGFLEDVNNDLSNLESTIQDDSIWLTKATPLLHSIRMDTFHIDSAEVIMKLIVKISRMTANTVTYRDVTNSGNLNIISDFDLKTKIVDYYITMEGVKFVDDYLHEYFNIFVMPFVFREFNVLSGQLENPEIIHSIHFANVFTGYYSMIQQRKAAYVNLMTKNNSLIESLQGQL
jgi:hypothetical protein